MMLRGNSLRELTARKWDILTIFMMSAALIGLIDGLIGVLLGYMLSGLMPYLVPNMRMMGGGSVVTLTSVLGSLLVAVIVGVVAGAIPAYQASKLKPVDALRYE